MDINDEVIKVISKCMIQVMKDIAPEPLDKTVGSRITGIVESKKRFNIIIGGADYTSVPSCNDIDYKLNDSIWVKYPQNNESKMFILGRRFD